MKHRRPTHQPEGNPCSRTGCGWPADLHAEPREPRTTQDSDGERQQIVFAGIDGEGQTDHDTNEHFYTMLMCVSEEREQWRIDNRNGLTTRECLDFICDLPSHLKIFAYSFGYDTTKIIEGFSDGRPQGFSDKDIYHLMRPETRQRERRMPGGKMRSVLVPIMWENFAINWMQGKLSLKRTAPAGSKNKWEPLHTVYDIWRFFGSKFTSALEDWQVPEFGEVNGVMKRLTREERKVILDKMREMKDWRPNFDKLDQQAVAQYCFDECLYMAQLARKLVEAHEQANIPLKQFFGAGSSADAMLRQMRIDVHVKQAREFNPIPREIAHAIAVAFVGGRFENNRVGSVREYVHSYDISSAYPYQLCQLPCLIHGTWRKSRSQSDVEQATAACVKYRLPVPERKLDWAPFPFRLPDGCIVFPESSDGGYVWKDEFLAGQRLFPNVVLEHAYVYESTCDCKLFIAGEQSIPKFYLLRIKIGKEGPGIVIKLAINSNYGKIAQLVGSREGRFTSMMWAGLITSGCRAQVLDAMALHQDLSNLLMVATDGIATLEKLVLPPPALDTGTTDAVDEKGRPVRKPLGGWEYKGLPKGLFLARPGIYFPLDPTEDELKMVRARGVGRGAVYKQWRTIVEAFERGEPGVRVNDLSRFLGAKTSVFRSADGKRYSRSENYGRWITRPVDMTFDPLPKREWGPNGTLALRRFEGMTSAAYNKAVMSQEAIEMTQMTQECLEQPDGGDFAIEAAENYA